MPLLCLRRLLLLLCGLGAAAGFGDPVHGKAVFQQSCALCHATGLPGQAAAGQGPPLAGIVGRSSASLPTFSYTRALRAADLIWDASTLVKGRTSPDGPSFPTCPCSPTRLPSR